MALIEAKGLEMKYSDGTHAIRGISLNIEEGEFVAVMGPSGSGKSTLLHILGLLDYQTKGDYRFNNKFVRNYSLDELARIRNKTMGFVFQTFNLLARTSVLENIKLPLLYSNIPERKWNTLANEALESVHLSHRKNHEPSQLSGGERQRVAIARAFVTNPKIVFADEPTGNLDTKSGDVIIELLQKLNNLGHTIILITHEEYVAEHARRIISIRDGKIESDKVVRQQRLTNDGNSGV